MKILYISNNDGGAPKTLLNIIRSVRQWVEPIVLFNHRGDESLVFEQEGIECIYIPFIYEIHYKDIFANKSLYEKYRYIRYRLFGSVIINKKLPSLVRKALNGRKIDIVHTNTAAITIGMNIAQYLAAKHVWRFSEFQDLDFQGRPFWGWHHFHGLASKSDAVIASSKPIYDHYNLSKHKNSHLLWNPVLSKEEATYDPQKLPFILFAANVIIEGKGLHDLLEAYGLSQLPNQGIRLKIAGRLFPGDYQNKLERTIEKYELANHIDWLGYCNVKPLMQQALALIMPSLNEALGRVAIEAMFYGCPQIVRNTGGANDYLKHGINGYFFDNIDNLTDILNEIVQRDNSTLIKTAQQFAIESFSIEEYGRKILKVYRDLL